MKDVVEALNKRLQRLSKSFSLTWLADFSDFIQFLHTNDLTQQILKEIKKEKEKAYAPLFRDLKRLLEDGKNCLYELQRAFPSKDNIVTAVRALLNTKIDLKEIDNPFFDLESVYRRYCADFVSLFRLLRKEGLPSDFQKYCHQNGSNLNFAIDSTTALAFSPYFQKCEQDIETLLGQRAISAWGRWDEVLKWAEWTKNGISPTNVEFGNNLTVMFHEYKISETVQSFGLFFLEQLANMPKVTIGSEICLKAIELFLDQNDQYWIIVHFGGEKGEKSEFFIKRLQRGAQSYALLQTLLEAEPYSLINFPRLSHALGELEIKKELKKVFFPRKKFAGSCVQLCEHDVVVDATAVIKHLSSLQRDKKELPSLNWGYYHRNSPVRV